MSRGRQEVFISNHHLKGKNHETKLCKKRIQRDTELFLKNGGKIEHPGNVFAIDETKERSKAFVINRNKAPAYLKDGEYNKAKGGR